MMSNVFIVFDRLFKRNLYPLIKLIVMSHLHFNKLTLYFSLVFDYWHAHIYKLTAFN